MNIESISGVIIWTPGKTGLISVTVQAINSAGVDTQSFDINVSRIPQFSCSSQVKVIPLGDSITDGTEFTRLPEPLKGIYSRFSLSLLMYPIKRNTY